MPNNGKLFKDFVFKSAIYLMIILVLMVILCIYNKIFIIPSICLFIILTAYTIVSNGKKKNEITNHLMEIASDVNVVAKKNLISSPIPLVIIETDGRVVWKSKTFVTEFQDIQIGPYLTNLVKEIKIELGEDGENKEVSKMITIANKSYWVKGAVSKSKKKDARNQKEYMLNLYFTDVTRYNVLFDEYNNSKLVICLVTIDNYEDLLKRALPQEKLELIAKIEKVIYDWAESTHGLILKTSNDSFIYVFEQQYIPELEKDKFSILDNVKNVDDNIPISLSIAISNEGDTIYEKYKSAVKALDIVLGRGGDQVVIRRDGKYKFYGGNSLEIEKRTKVKARTISNSISDMIQASDNVFIMGHKNIDIDALGSAMGMYRLAKALEVNCYIVSEPKGNSLDKYIDEINKNDEYDDLIMPISTAIENVTDNSLLIIVDTHKTTYVEYPELLDKVKKKIIIDHHRKVTDYIEDADISFHEVYASSAAELVTEIIQYAKVPVELSLLEAEGLYGGIMVDTKDFTFKTGVRTFEAAAFLRKFGVDIIRVKKWFQADLESYNTISEIVRDAEIINDSIAIGVYNNYEDENANLICAKAADELLTIADINASFVLGKIEDTVFISGRSIGEINVQVILEKLGGGGHITLAGAQLEGMSIEDAKKELITRIEEYFEEIE